MENSLPVGLWWPAAKERSGAIDLIRHTPQFLEQLSTCTHTASVGVSDLEFFCSISGQLCLVWVHVVDVPHVCMQMSFSFRLKRLKKDPEKLGLAIFYPNLLREVAMMLVSSKTSTTTAAILRKECVGGAVSDLLCEV